MEIASLLAYSAWNTAGNALGIATATASRAGPTSRRAPPVPRWRSWSSRPKRTVEPTDEPTDEPTGEPTAPAPTDAGADTSQPSSDAGPGRLASTGAPLKSGAAAVVALVLVGGALLVLRRRMLS
ncbi:DUF4127 family protein [Georgenia satyanarayanai]|uniref:DUF4127 family protein n=1 Tax=Georgenia satyanarayanai TaxID=860221 RepID=UPI00203B243A|nr:DUF4127 family protein [Georgenia satyanarayanai]MCM3659742.1 DUF4127 family protein [Georgenia satyanarayanai]